MPKCKNSTELPNTTEKYNQSVLGRTPVRSSHGKMSYRLLRWQIFNSFQIIYNTYTHRLVSQN